MYWTSRTNEPRSRIITRVGQPALTYVRSLAYYPHSYCNIRLLATTYSQSIGVDQPCSELTATQVDASIARWFCAARLQP